MKKNIALLLMSFFTVLCFSQDLIVTNTGDSINCKITKIKPDLIYFTFKYNSEIRNTLLPVGDIKEYFQNYYSKSDISEEILRARGKFNHLRIAVNGGLSFETAKTDANLPNEYKKYSKELKSGFNLGASLTYYFSESLGMGFKYNRFMTVNSLDNAQMTSGAMTYTGKLSEDIKVSFYGPSFSTRFINRDRKNAFILNYSIGYLDYKDNLGFGNLLNEKITSGTFGMDMDLGYDVGISKSLSLGFQLSLVSGILTKYKIDGMTFDLEKGEYESLYRIDFSVGLRFNK